MTLPLSTPLSQNLQRKLERMQQDELRQELHAHLTAFQSVGHIGLATFPNRDAIAGLLHAAAMLLEETPLTMAVTRDLRSILADMM